MPANIFDLAVALVQVSPEVLPRLVEALGNHVTPEQKQSLLDMQQTPTRNSMLMTISGAQWQQPRPQFQQNLMDTIRYVPRQDLNVIVLSVARERHRQVKELFLFVRLFLILCLITLVIGIVLITYNHQLGGTLTAIGGFLGAIGGFVFKTHSESHKRLDEFLKNF